MGTHLAHKLDDPEARHRQLTAITDLVQDLRDDGSFRYEPRRAGFRWPWQPDTLLATGFGTSRVIVGGDLNARQDEQYRDGSNPDQLLGAAGLTHAIDQLRATGDPSAIARADEMAKRPTGAVRRIDHVYAAGMHASDVAIAAVPNVELGGNLRPTDHRGMVADLR